MAGVRRGNSIVFLSVTCLVTLCINLAGARRYRSCEEGCCIHEYCAYHRICYPKIHCRFGCPDGTCVGQEGETSTKNQPPGRPTGHSSSSPNVPSIRASANFKGPGGFSEIVKDTSHHDKNQKLAQAKPEPATPLKIPVWEERYFNQNNEITPSLRSSASQRAHNQIFAHASQKRDVPRGGADSLTARQQTGAAVGQSGMVSTAQDIAQGLPGSSGICMPSPPCKVGDDCGMGHVCAFNYNLGYSTCQYNLEIGSTLCYDKNGELNLQTAS